MLASLSDSLFRGKKMNTLLGTIITALVTDENDKFYFVQKDGVTFALSKEEGEQADNKTKQIKINIFSFFIINCPKA